MVILADGDKDDIGKLEKEEKKRKAAGLEWAYVVTTIDEFEMMLALAEEREALMTGAAASSSGAACSSGAARGGARREEDEAEQRSEPERPVRAACKKRRKEKDLFERAEEMAEELEVTTGPSSETDEEWKSEVQKERELKEFEEMLDKAGLAQYLRVYVENGVRSVDAFHALDDEEFGALAAACNYEKRSAEMSVEEGTYDKEIEVKEEEEEDVLSGGAKEEWPRRAAEDKGKSPAKWWNDI